MMRAAMLLALIVATPASADKHALPVRQESFIMHVKGPQGGDSAPISAHAYVDVRELPALVRSAPSGPAVQRGQVCGRNSKCIALDDRPTSVPEIEAKRDGGK